MAMVHVTSKSFLINLPDFKKTSNNFTLIETKWSRGILVAMIFAAFWGKKNIGFCIAPSVTFAPKEGSTIFYSSELGEVKATEFQSLNKFTRNHDNPPNYFNIKNGRQVDNERQAKDLLGKDIQNVDKRYRSRSRANNRSIVNIYVQKIKDKIKELFFRLKYMIRKLGKKSEMVENVKEPINLAEINAHRGKFAKQATEKPRFTEKFPQQAKNNIYHHQNFLFKNSDENMKRDGELNYQVFVGFIKKVFKPGGKIKTDFSPSEFEEILEEFNFNFSKLRLKVEEEIYWRKALAMVAHQVIDSKTTKFKDSPNKYFKKLMIALLVNSKLGSDRGKKKPNLSRDIYEKILSEKMAEVYLKGEDITYEMKRIELSGEAYDVYGHYFFGNMDLKISDDIALLTLQAKKNPMILEGINIFHSHGNVEKKIAKVDELFEAISEKEIFETQEERFLGLKFIKWAHGREDSLIVRKSIEFKIADLALDSYLLFPSTNHSLENKSEAARSFKEALDKNPYHFYSVSNGRFAYPDWLSVGISPIGIDYTQKEILKSQMKNIVNAQRRPYQRYFWVDSTLMARSLFEKFEKNHEFVPQLYPQRKIFLDSKDWDSFKKAFDEAPKHHEMITFLNEYECAKLEEKLDMIKYALLRSRSVTIPANTKILKSRNKDFNFVRRLAFEEGKMLWLQLVAVKVYTFDSNATPNEFAKLIIEISPQLNSLKNEAKGVDGLGELIDYIKLFLGQISVKLANQLRIL